MPEAATAEEIETVYLEGWKLGLKAIAIYRDNSKRSQPLSTGKKKDDGISAEASETIESLRTQLAAAQVEATRPHRRRLPAERAAITHRFDISGHEGYITVGLYADGQPGEIFLKMAKEGSTISGLMDTLATSVSLALQYGVPLKDVVNKFAHVRFEPSGFTGNPEIPIAKSLVDYIFRWLGSRFLPTEDKAALGLIDRSALVDEAVGSAAGSRASASGAARPPPAAGLALPPVVEPGARPRTDERGSRVADRHRDGRAAPPRRSPRRSWWSSRPTAPRTATRPTATGSGRSRTSRARSAVIAGRRREGRFAVQADAPSCAECGSIMVRNGSCYKCLNCGSTSGCS